MKQWALTRRDRWTPSKYPVGTRFIFMAFESGGNYVWVRLFHSMHQYPFERERKRYERLGIRIVQTGFVRFKTRYAPQHGVVRPL